MRDLPLVVAVPGAGRVPLSSEDAQVEVRTPNEKGECRKAPPRPPRVFPVTDPDDWCGDHPERRLTGGAG